MLWLVGRILKYLIIFGVVIAIIGAAVVFFFNPNNFKETINSQLKSYTGLPLQANGDIKWSLHPKPVIFLQDVVSDATSNISVSLKEVAIYIDPYSLLKDSLVVTSLQITDATIALNATTSPDSILPDQAPPASAPIQNGKVFIVQELVLTSADISIKNEASNLNLEIKNANISSNNLVLNSGGTLSPFTLNGTLVDVNHHLTTSINTVIKPDFPKQELSLEPLTIGWNEIELNGKANVTHLLTTPVIKGELSLDTADFNALLKKISPYLANTNMATNHALAFKTTYDYSTNEQILDLNNIDLKLDEGTLSGTCKISFQSPYRAEFAIIAENMNFSPIKVLFDALFPGLPSNTLVSIDFIKNFSIAGKFTGSKLQYGDVHIDQTTFEIIGENGLIQIQPFTLSAYNGMHNLSVTLDVQSKEEPFFQITEQADKVTLEPWLKLINYTQVIEGEATIKASLEALGNTYEELKQSLTGNINLFIKNGTLFDIDLDKLMTFTAKTVNDVFEQLNRTAGTDLYTLLRSKSIGWIETQKDNPRTAFDTFELKTDIKQGVSDQSSLSLLNKSYEMKATGGFDLIQNIINFDALISYRTPVTADIPELAKFMQQAPLPLTIGGTVDKPTFGPNIQNYAASVINLTQSDIMNKALTIMLANSPGNGATNKTASELFITSLDGLNK